MTFFNPLYLWSLLGMIIPIAIHLWSRRKVIKIKVGSTKLLLESEPKRTSTVRPNELCLLLLRCLSILLLALILSQPRFKGKEKNDPLAYVIDPSLMTDQKVQRFLKDIPAESIRIMSEGFPKVSDYTPLETGNEIPNIWQLAGTMEIVPADSIIAVTNAFLSGIKGKRPVVPSHINWMVLNSEDSSDQIVEVVKKRDSFELLTLKSDFEKLQFEKKKLPKNSSEIMKVIRDDSIQVNGRTFPLNQVRSFNILIVATDSLLGQQHYIGSAYKAVSSFLETSINIKKTSEIDSINADFYDISVWLGVEPPSGISKTKLVFRPDILAEKLVVEGNSKNEFFLTKLLDAENSVTDYLAEELHEILNLHDHLEKKVEPYDKRVMNVEELRPVGSGVSRTSQHASFVDISPWLWGLVILVLITERILAKYRKQ